jgi:hypothetical protein
MDSVYYPAWNALEFIALCDSAKLAVIGIEGYIIEGRDIVPQMNIIADWSAIKRPTWEEFYAACNLESRNFVARYQHSHLYFDFTIIESGSWKGR